MRAPRFWWQAAPSLSALLLSPFGLIWGALSGQRMQRKGEDADAPVLCIGNFTAGGAGKTPTALACAALLARHGFKPAFLTRGYGGTLAKDGSAHRVDLHAHTALQAGDEPLLLARQAATFIASDRVKGANAATAMGADILVMDDGLQNPGLNKTLAIAVVDGQTGIGNGLCIPAGPLRAPLEAQQPKVDALIILGDGEPGKQVAQRMGAFGKPAFYANLQPDAGALARLHGKKVIAFAGIGRPEKFFDTLQAGGIDIADAFAFDDHQLLDDQEIALLQDTARTQNAVLVTTEKDFVRVSSAFSPDEQPHVLPVRLKFDDEAGFTRFLLRSLQKRP